MQAQAPLTRRRHLQFLGAGATALVAAMSAACGTGQGDQAGKGSASGAPIAMRFMTRGSDGYKAWFTQMADQFHQRNPRVTVQIEHVTGSPSYHEKLITQQASGDPPDTVFTTNDYMFEEA